VASLKDIRRRIGSVKNTQQITKAMKLVAASRLRRAQQAIASARPFAEKLEAMTGRVIDELQGGVGSADSTVRGDFLGELHPLLSSAKAPEGARAKIGLLIVSSDRGLCGAYNSSVSRFAARLYKEWSQQRPDKDIELYYVGRKAYEALVRKGMQGQLFADFWQGRLTPAKSDSIAKSMMEKFLSGELSEVHVIYTQFRSAISQTVSLAQVLPLKPEADSSPSSVGNDEQAWPFIYEPDRKAILSTLLPQLVRTQFYRMFADSVASEFGAKMTAMDNATRNAGDMISKLTLEANRVRQAAITKELMEIVSGAEAIKG
jgi:F-type H+-transporting ATPase subunit gamma